MCVRTCGCWNEQRFFPVPVSPPAKERRRKRREEGQEEEEQEEREEKRRRRRRAKKETWENGKMRKNRDIRS